MRIGGSVAGVTTRVLGLSTLALIWLGPIASGGEYNRPALVKVVSKLGGFELQAPRSWKLTEVLSETAYDGLTTGQEVSSPGDHVTFGIRIRRARDFRGLVEIDRKNLDDSSFWYVSKLALTLTPNKSPMLYERNRQIPGYRSARYFIDAGLHSTDCVRGYAEVGIAGEEGIFLTGRMPCGDPEAEFGEFMSLGPGAPERLFLEMAMSLRVSRKWGTVE